MTVNDFLTKHGYPVLERDLEKKTTMLVKNFDDTKWGKKHAPYPCICMEKLDGVCALAININGNVELYSRTGRKLKNVGHLEVLLEYTMPENYVVCVEVCHPSLSLEQISGIVNPNRTEPLEEELDQTWLMDAYMGAFDMITLLEFLDGESHTTFQVRLKELARYTRHGMKVTLPANIIAQDEEQAVGFFNAIVETGGEGTVQALPDMPWKAGYKNHAKTKRVRGVDYDLEVVAIEEGKGKRAGMAGRVIVLWRSGGIASNARKRLAVDGRFTDEQRIHMLQHPEEYIGKIVHVHALQIGSAGALRLPKIRSFRMDKFVADL